MVAGFGGSQVLVLAVVAVVIAGALIGVYVFTSQNGSHSTSVSHTSLSNSTSTSSVRSSTSPSSTSQTSSSSATTSTSQNLVDLSGFVSVSGYGTKVAEVDFVAVGGQFSSSIRNGEYNVSLPANSSYNVTARWTGKYSWQGGAVSLGEFYVPGGSPYLGHPFFGQTPDSDIFVSGNVTLTGQGTTPQRLTFVSSFGTYNATVLSQDYWLSLPNLATYNAVVEWAGTYPWENGTTVSAFLLDAPAGTHSVSENFQGSTPDSVIGISGQVTASGNQTRAVSMLFTSAEHNLNVTTFPSHGRYSIQLPNSASYSVDISWVGAFAWQNGTDTTNSLAVSESPGTANLTRDFKITTPDSWVRVYGQTYLSASCTSAKTIGFGASRYDYHKGVQVNIEGSYSTFLPNGLLYDVSVGWTGSYSWQHGTVDAGNITVNHENGTYWQREDFSVSTPNCLIQVTGFYTVFLNPDGWLDFSYNGQNYYAQLTNPSCFSSECTFSYSVTLPNLATYSVSAYDPSNGPAYCQEPGLALNQYGSSSSLVGPHYYC